MSSAVARTACARGALATLLSLMLTLSSAPADASSDPAYDARLMASCLVLTYAPVAVGAGISDLGRDPGERSAWPLYIPGAGPFIQIGRVSPDVPETVGLIMIGTLQATALLGVVISLREMVSPPPPGPTCYERPPAEGGCTGPLPPADYQYPPRPRERGKPSALFTGNGLSIRF